MCRECYPSDLRVWHVSECDSGWVQNAMRSPVGCSASDMATDLATVLDWVSARHSHGRVRLVGTEQSATAFFIMNAFLAPRYQQLVAGAYFYSPLAYLGRLDSLVAAAGATIRGVLEVGGAGARAGAGAALALAPHKLAQTQSNNPALFFLYFCRCAHAAL